MTRSDDHPRTSASTLLDRLARVTTAVSRYDLLLAVIPAAFVLAAVLGALATTATRDAVLVAALVGVAAMVDALFLNPPGRGATPNR